jgi:Ca2+-binding EF-hand superfamily protein
VRKLFTLIDVNGNGFVNLREFERHLAVNGVKLEREIVEQIYSLILSFNPTAGSASQIHARESFEDHFNSVILN